MTPPSRTRTVPAITAQKPIPTDAVTPGRVRRSSGPFWRSLQRIATRTARITPPINGVPSRNRNICGLAIESPRTVAKPPRIRNAHSFASFPLAENVPARPVAVIHGRKTPRMTRTPPVNTSHPALALPSRGGAGRADGVAPRPGGGCCPRPWGGGCGSGCAGWGRCPSSSMRGWSCTPRMGASAPRRSRPTICGVPRRTIAGDLPAPMLATSESEIPRGEGWTYEPKWDGFRTIVAVGEGGDVRLVSRDGRPLGRYFPEIVQLVAERPPGAFVADGQLLVTRPPGLEVDHL